MLCSIEEGGPQRLRPNISSHRPPRQVAPPPELVPVEHSAAYLLRSRRPDGEDDEDSLAITQREREPFTGNAVEWYLRRIDKSLDEGDAEPPAAAKAYYRASQSPAGASAAKGVVSAMGAAVKLGTGAMKAAAPVGKWAVMQGLSAAAKLASSSERSSKSQDERSENK